MRRAFIAAICFLFFTCNTAVTKLDKLHWLAGMWQMKTAEGSFTEIWSKQNDTMLIGKGFFITASGDTTFKEALSIINRNDTLYYVPVVAEQNDGKPVYFKEHSFTATEIIFQNATHDFPQRIIYTKIDDNNITAKVTGVENGRVKTEEFTLIKYQ